MALRASTFFKKLTHNYSKLVTSMSWKFESDTRLRIDLPGFHYGDFTRLGYVSMLSACKFMEHQRIFTCEDRDARDDRQSLNHFLSYIGSLTDPETLNAVVISHQTYHFTQAMYRHTAIGRPLKYTSDLGFMETRSFSQCMELRDGQSNELLATNERNIMLLSKSTHKPVPLPEDFKRRFSGHVTGTRKMIGRVPECPRPSYKMSFQVNHSDTDFLYHANNTTFVRFCLDCATNATVDKFYREIQGDFLAYEVSDITMSHFTEMFPGDEVTVATWQDADNAFCIYFRLYCGETLSFTATMSVREEMPAEPANVAVTSSML